LKKSPIKKATLGQMAAQIIRERIIRGAYPQGYRLVEDELAEEFAISRASLRDALMQLEADGIVVREVNKCTLVRSFSKKDVYDLFRLRAIIECGAAKIAALSETVSFEKMEDCIRHMEMGNFSSALDFLYEDIALHDMIIESTQNPFIRKVWMDIRSQYLMLMHKYFTERTERFVSNAPLHHRIVELIRNKDLEELERYLTSHIMGTVEDVAETVE